MAHDLAKAFPRKRFFVEMFTRDIAAEDCVLDLVDNSIDALIKQQKIDLDGTLKGIGKRPPGGRGAIRVTISKTEIAVEDNCGGISLHKAKEDVFNFGHSKKVVGALTEHGIGAYGIGLKRAIFKLGRYFQVESIHNSISFVVEQDLDQWAEHDEKIEQWHFPLKSKTVKGLDSAKGGTRVRITQLKSEIVALIDGDRFADQIRTQIAKTYGLFLSTYADVFVNDELVVANQIPLGHNISVGFEKAEYDDHGVSVRVVAGVAAPGPRNVWEMEKAGWYVVCNGRVVVFADKTELTGWNRDIMPQFHSSKARGFVGIATFVSDDPLKLPWTTTKRGLNHESPVFQHARSRMQQVGSVVYRALQELSPQKDEEDSAQSVRLGTSQASLKEAMGGGTSHIRLPSRTRKKKDEVADPSIQYTVSAERLAAVKKHIGNTRLGNGDIGRYTFDYFIRQEGLE